MISIKCRVNHVESAAVAELADARDLKSLGGRLPYRFDSGQRHHFFKIEPINLKKAVDRTKPQRHGIKHSCR